AELGALTFRRPDVARFPCLRLVREACAAGGCAPAVVAAADEWAVGRFLEGAIKYTDIAAAAERALAAAPRMEITSLEAVYEANDWTWKYLSR
ncbi:MAG: 1-deoxy-D-xylulose-5-phosphate reductoisomerase, partial [Kiritimatiellae bacterium]|nr:1-deoxy-D-xylulose-5-phosphate reductoisomerase [Kiritimatiellia bacterium]